VKSNKTLLAILALLLVLLVGLGGLFLWLTGGADTEDEQAEEVPTGLVHVTSIYTADGENLLRPVGIGADEDGGFFVTLRDAQRVVEFDRNGRWQRTWGERGVAGGQLMAPVGVDVDRLAGHVYVTDRSRLRLVCYSTEGEFLWEQPVLNPITPVVTPDGVLVTTFGPLVLLSDQGEVVREVGSRGPQPGQFDYARGAVSAVGTDVIVADSNNSRVQRVALQGETTATVRWVDGAPPRFQDDPQVAYGLPSSVALDDQGRTYVLDGFKHSIVVLDSETGKRLHVFNELQGRGDGRFNLPTGIVHLGGDTFAITDTYNDRVQIVRLLLPGEDSVVNRYPWLWLLPPAALLGLLAWLLSRTRYFATDAAVQRAVDEGNLRLIVAVGRRLYVTTPVAERLSDYEEDGIALGEYLVAVPVSDDEPAQAAETLLLAAKPDGWKRFVSPRPRIVVEGDGETQMAGERGIKVFTYDELASTYTVGDGPKSADAASDDDGSDDDVS